MSNKKALAVEFINKIRTSKPQDLNKLILNEVGEEMANFFLDYARLLMAQQPNHPVENAGSLMLMGYLIRAKEDQRLSSFQSYKLPPGQYLQ